MGDKLVDEVLRYVEATIRYLSEDGTAQKARDLLARLRSAPETRMAAWKCKARNSWLPEPQDCDWPVCGCDPHANRVIEALGESGSLAALTLAEQKTSNTSYIYKD